MSTEKERETHVYMAKLAEQAERYDGMSIFFPAMYVGFSARILFPCIWLACLRLCFYFAMLIVDAKPHYVNHLLSLSLYLLEGNRFKMDPCDFVFYLCMCDVLAI